MQYVLLQGGCVEGLAPASSAPRVRSSCEVQLFCRTPRAFPGLGWHRSAPKGVAAASAVAAAALCYCLASDHCRSRIDHRMQQHSRVPSREPCPPPLSPVASGGPSRLSRARSSAPLSRSPCCERRSSLVSSIGLQNGRAKAPHSCLCRPTDARSAGAAAPGGGGGAAACRGPAVAPRPIDSGRCTLRHAQPSSAARPGSTIRKAS